MRSLTLKKAVRYAISSGAQKQPAAHMQFMLAYMLEKALEENKAISNITWFRNAKILPGKEENSNLRLVHNSGSAGSPASNKASVATQLRRQISACLPGRSLTLCVQISGLCTPLALY